MGVSGSTEQPDVLVIGAGAAGGVVAKHMAANGFSVVALEQGGWVNQGELPGDKPEFELAQVSRWSPDPNVRNNPADYPVEQSNSEGPPVWLFNGVGGSTVLYAAVWVRPSPSDFLVRTLDGVADDWPIGYHDLQPYFEAVDDEFGASGMGGNPAYPPGAAPPLPPLPIGPSGRLAAEGMNKLGWHWWPGGNSIPSLAHGNQAQCVRLGVCWEGCPAGAKGSTDVTHWPAAIADGAKLITGARVKEITLDEQGRANGAVYIDRQGVERFQPAAVVVLSSGGIGTPRLLQLSTSGRFPNGLANSSGAVGRRLMLHPSAIVAGTFEGERFVEMGPSGAKIQSMQFYETDKSRGFVRGAYWTVWDGVGAHLNVARRSFGEGVQQEPLWGSAFSKVMRESVGHTVTWAAVAEDLPEDHNRVTLHPTLTDADGLPAAQVTYRLAENTKKLIDWNIDRISEAFAASGAVRSWPVTRNGSPGHVLGTARMGNDPDDSVVDADHRAHDVPNLYIVDGSSFVTGFGVNPTATIAALAKRAAVRLVEHARDQVVAS